MNGEGDPPSTPRLDLSRRAVGAVCTCAGSRRTSAAGGDGARETLALAQPLQHDAHHSGSSRCPRNGDERETVRAAHDHTSSGAGARLLAQVA